MATRLIYGCGYIGLRVARRWRDQGDRVFAVTRSEANAERLRGEGVEPVVADVTQPETLARAPAADTVLFAVGYDRSAGPSIHSVYADGFANALQAASPETRRLVYLSTTGVYGDAGGDWVDETTPPNPGRDGGRASLAAERVLRGGPFADRGVALRLAGIYGPGRVPYLDKLRAGEPIAAAESGWLNLIHADDAAACVVAVAAAETPPPILCVSDGAPPQRRDYYGEVARLLAAPAPTFVAPAEGSPRAARAAADKRVSNRRIVERLGFSPASPDYRAGLAAIVAALT